ncbi:MAG TPA: MBL fold metallo-hydrolase [Polyangiaceae bacterium]|nr:MBL fold metallo-hydrolase [Polyangiaceae bacterium]
MRPVSIAPSIEAFAALTPTLPPATHTNSYALGERDVLLVEPATPYDEERRAWLEWARTFPSRGRRLAGILLTHHHEDHVGGAAFLARELDLPVLAHELTAEKLPEVPVSRRISEGEELVLEGPTPTRWTVLHTPGHAKGHVCLHERTLGAVVVGDMVATVGTILVDTRDGDMRVYIEQLERLRDLGASVALPAHGAPIPDPSALFSHYVQHRRKREAKILAALRAFGDPGATIPELVPVAYDDTPEAAWPFAAMAVGAHLAKLREEGLSTEDDGRYRALPASGSTP